MLTTPRNLGPNRAVEIEELRKNEKIEGKKMGEMGYYGEAIFIAFFFFFCLFVFSFAEKKIGTMGFFGSNINALASISLKNEGKGGRRGGEGKIQKRVKSGICRDVVLRVNTTLHKWGGGEAIKGVSFVSHGVRYLFPTKKKNRLKAWCWRCCVLNTQQMFS